MLGAEYLEINANIDTPDFIEKQLFEGFSTNPFSLDASTDITSVFGEALIPLVSGKPGIDFLELELGWRWSEHSITGSASTYKVAVSYYPTADFQFRASYNRAVRSPAINELYRRQQVQFNGIQDPCTQTGSDGTGLAPGNVVYVGGFGAGEFPILQTPELAETCFATGLPEAALYDSLLKEISGIEDRGGNSNLRNEDASTTSIGFVWTPYSMDGLSVSFDYFNVEIEDYITTTPVNAPQIMINCFDTSLGRGGPGSPACNAVGRDNEGRLNRIFLGYQNLGLHEVSGFDINIDYGFEFLSGFMDINYFATKIEERSIKDNTYGEVNFDCVGIFNGDCDNLISYPVFDFKHRMTAGWSRGF